MYVDAGVLSPLLSPPSAPAVPNSGWAAVRWRTEEGGVSRLERRGYGGLGFRMAKRRRWEGVNHDLGTRLSKM